MAREYMPDVSPAAGKFDVSGETTTPKMDDHLITGGATTPKSLFFVNLGETVTALPRKNDKFHCQSVGNPR